MPNILDTNGLQTQTRSELIAFYTAQFKSIYGNDINLDSDTPDGQIMGDFVQSVLDLEDLLTQIYNMFDPDNAVGVVLDQRVAINGIQRQAGTFTTTPITIITSDAVSLYGLDQMINPVFTIADNAGNRWQLETTQNISGAGSTVIEFRSAVSGAVLTVPNTITVPVTVVLGVTSVNNPTTYTVLGINEETDAALKIRRQKSVALPSQGYLAGLLAALENINGVSSAFVYENNTDSTDGDGVPSHSIWVIVAGSALDADVANAIYVKRNAGCGMFGATTLTITQVDGSPFVIKWDKVTSENLFIKFTATSLDGVNPPNIAAIRSGLVTSFVPGVNQEVNINGLATDVQDIDGNTLVTIAGFSTTSGGSYTDTLNPATKSRQFVVTSENIIILPIILNPVTSSVVHGNTKQFSALGGFGAYTFSIFTNNSGGSINSGTGLYTAGATHPVTDTIRVTDAQGHTTDSTVSVT